MVTCQICQRNFRIITNSHLLRKHGISVEEYKRLYGQDLISEETRNKRIKLMFDWDILPLGKQPDSVIAKDLGINRRVVAKQRHKRKIPPFIGYILTQEGNPVRSLHEAMYDAYLHWQDIPHQHEVAIEGTTRIADFLIGGKVIEIAGMFGYEKYKEKLVRKMAEYKKVGIEVEYLGASKVEMLYADCPVRIKLRPERECSLCHKRTHSLLQGYCRKCYMVIWHQEHGEDSVCEKCGKSFKKDKHNPGKYCSRECYWSAMTINWPSLEILEKQLKVKTSRELAEELGVTVDALHMHMHRERKKKL